MGEPFIDDEQRRMLPAPGWRPETEAYWRAAGRGQLVVQQCGQCGTHRWPMSAGCYHCLSTAWEWAPVPGTGKVFSYTWVDYPPPPEGEEHRNVTVVELDGTNGPDPIRVISWVTTDRASLACDLPVEVSFVEVDDEVAVPAWKPRA